MGWTNFIIIESLKLLIETNREVDELEDYKRDALEDALGEDAGQLAEMEDVRWADVTLKDLKSLYTAYERMESIAGFEYDKLLLFWLEHRGVEYHIKSEFQINLEEYTEKGYNVLRR